MPAAGDYSLASFELSIGGLGAQHRRQRVTLDLVNHHETGVFSLAKLVPEAGRPGRFLGFAAVFHRSGSLSAALPSGLAGLAAATPMSPPARVAAPAFSDFIVNAQNAHVIKEIVKDNIVALARIGGLGPDDFCYPLSKRTYILGNNIATAAYILAGPLTGLPTGLTAQQLTNDAAEELCDEYEDEEEDEEEEDEGEPPGIYSLNHLLNPAYVRPTHSYRVTFNGRLYFEGPQEIQLRGAFGGVAYPGLTVPPSTMTPLDGIEFVLPASGSTARAVSNYICPAALPLASVTTTRSTNDTLSCSGGSLPLGQSFTLNVQSVPAPLAGMGAALLAHQNGAYLPPFTVPGP